MRYIALMVDQRERPSYTPLSALLQERRVALSASITEPEIRTYFEHMVGFHIRSAMRNETPGRHRWMIAVSYQEDALFLHELEGLNQRGVYKFIESAVSAELAKAEAELHGFLNPRPKKDKEETHNITPSIKEGGRRRVNYHLLVESQELNLIKKILQLPEVIEDIANDYQVQRLPKYAHDLAKTFSEFYENCKVIDATDKDLTIARLALVRVAQKTLADVLSLMGISAPKKM